MTVLDEMTRQICRKSYQYFDIIYDMTSADTTDTIDDLDNVDTESMQTVDDRQNKQESEERKRKNVGCKMYENQISILNIRLRMYGFNSPADLLVQFRDGLWPEGKVDIKNKDGSIKNATNNQYVELQGESVPALWREIKNYDSIYEYYRTKRKYSVKYAKCLVSYLKSHKDIFFGAHPEELANLTPHKRHWVLGAMRNFARYCLYEYGKDDIEHLVNKIIKRYQLSRGLDMKTKVYIVDDDYIQRNVNFIMATTGDIGFNIKFALYAGCRQDELIYMHDKQICSINTEHECEDKIHVITKGKFTAIVLNWFRNQKKAYLQIVPTEMWSKFRNRPFSQADLDVCNQYLKRAKIGMMDIRKLAFNIDYKTMGQLDAEVIAGRAKGVSAINYALYELDRMCKTYEQAYAKYGVKFD